MDTCERWFHEPGAAEQLYYFAAKGFFEPVINRKGEPTNIAVEKGFSHKHVTALRKVFNFGVHRKSAEEVVEYANCVLKQFLAMRSIWSELEERAAKKRAAP